MHSLLKVAGGLLLALLVLAVGVAVWNMTAYVAWGFAGRHCYRW